MELSVSIRLGSMESLELTIGAISKLLQLKLNYRCYFKAASAQALSANLQTPSTRQQ